MQPIIKNNLEQIRLVLKAHSVSIAEVFGSALRNDFNDKSDIDLLVTFSDSIELLEYADNYFSLKESLEKLLDRSVDLISSKSLKNPVLIEEINKSKQRVYAA